MKLKIAWLLFLLACGIFSGCGLSEYAEKVARQKYPPSSITCYSQDGKEIFSKTNVVVVHAETVYRIYDKSAETFYKNQMNTAPDYQFTGTCLVQTR